jgi:2-methylcitrate dehydratase PrpD
MQVTLKAAQFIAQTSVAEIPPAAMQQAKAGIMDWLFVALAGQAQADGALRNFREQLLSQGGNPESTVIGTPLRATANQAALVNGCIGHVLDYDETCPKVRSHLFAAIFPALLALAEARGASGKELLAAFIIGHEVAMRVGEAITPGWIKAGWHGTSLFGIFGAAAGSARLMGLDAGKTRMALGLAASMASGVAVNFGSLAKPLHAGMGAERGLFAAQLAHTGFTANPDALEGALGFYHAYNWGNPAQEDIIDRLGRPFGLETPGMSAIKLYPCCHGLATNIECGIRIHQQYALQCEEIAAIEMHSQPKTLCAMLSRRYEDSGEGLAWGYQGPPRQMQSILPTTGAQAKFSKEYAFSRALRDGEVRMHHLTDDAVNEPGIRQWMEKIRIYHNSELEAFSNQYPEETAPHAERMIIRLKDGRTIQEEEIFILGMTRRPLSADDVGFKYQDCGAVAGLASEQIDRIISLTRALDELEAVSLLTQHINA